MQIRYKDYYNKVYGGWLGKCVAGNIGAPFEGMKQLLNIAYSPQFLDNMLPNDDLDLQVLWLEVLEAKGIHASSDDLARIFAENCDYAPGEYAFFKKNYHRKIATPHSGTFNNSYYSDGMGAPIRAEIWAIINPGNPLSAARFAEMDALIDHRADSDAVNAEKFFAALESAAFFESDIKTLITVASEYVNKESRLYALIRDVVDWCATFSEWKVVRSLILRDYGSVEATHCLQNTGFILLSLLKSNLEFTKTVMTAVNCGFDTDCTAATAGAIVGLICGADALISEYGFNDIQFKLGVRSKKTDNSVSSLALDTARMGVYFSEETGGCRITEYSGEMHKFLAPDNWFSFKTEYIGEPAIGFGESAEVLVTVKNLTNQALNTAISVRADEPLIVNTADCNVILNGGEAETIRIIISVDRLAKRLPDGNTVRLTASAGGKEESVIIGFAGKKQYKIYGPYWKNNVEVPDLKQGESYWGYFNYDGEDAMMDAIRFYHMNSLPDIETPEAQIIYNGLHDANAETCGKIVQIGIDEIRIDDYENFMGQAAYCLVTAFYSDKQMSIGLQVGHMDAFKLYLNGICVASADYPVMFTPENIHKFNIEVKEGINTMVILLVKRNPGIKLSYNFLTGGVTSEHQTFDAVNLLNPKNIEDVVRVAKSAENHIIKEKRA